MILCNPPRQQEGFDMAQQGAWRSPRGLQLATGGLVLSLKPLNSITAQCHWPSGAYDSTHAGLATSWLVIPLDPKVFILPCLGATQWSRLLEAHCRPWARPCLLWGILHPRKLSGTNEIGIL